jgi:hypothetical protein
MVQEIEMVQRVTAVFNHHHEAEKAVAALRKSGITDDQFSFVARHDDKIATSGAGTTTEAVHTHGDSTGERAGKGALAGGGTGLLLGLGAAAIPGIGPFITAGAMAEVLGIVGGAAVSGTLVGAATGAVAGAFVKAGYSKEEADYYGEAVEKGSVLVAVDTTHNAITAEQVRSILSEHGGHFADTTHQGGHSRSATTV